MSKTVTYIVFAFIAIIGITLLIREYGKASATVAAAQGEQTKMQALLGLIGLSKQQQIVKEQNRATAKDWLKTIQEAASAVATVAGGSGGGD